MEQNAYQIALTHCQRLGYVDKTGKVDVLPVLDMSRKDELWGIECGNVIVSLKNGGFSRWDTAIKQEKQLSPKWKISLPLEDSLSECFVNRFKFKQALKELRLYGIEADDWLEGWYWSSEELGYDGNQIHTFDMSGGSYSTHDRFDTNGFIRLALY